MDTSLKRQTKSKCTTVFARLNEHIGKYPMRSCDTKNLAMKRENHLNLRSSGDLWGARKHADSGTAVGLWTGLAERRWSYNQGVLPLRSFFVK